ncbi:hypothetical protein K435DRAFT_848222 [Dendrothele bispora CBS 962.96]|uniref:Zn(2)-C6 fungal-type domain-containing protein n=1 Tax=Dendrothele bispora (strain CBS 962.96) TaxID=1314807 RepID=A0A4S8MVZ0_DENBC|nr:hypothetical protein K435DRAFT_848222 [Dendrothele bispora CBS 962.96]
MPYKSSKSPSASPSPSTSSSRSPLTQASPLMAPAPEEYDSPSRSSSTRGTPNRTSIDLPRTQTASKGGCWTCRLRRKKCDEQREGDSCRTCVRLTIDCLGWGPKRPEWMRDKQAVDAYKANIKAQLTRKGLIRGQPRSSLLQAQAQANNSTPSTPSTARPQTFHRYSAPVPSPSTSSLGLELDLGAFGMNGGYLDASSTHNLMPGVPGASNSGFHQLPAASYSDPSLSSLDLNASYFRYSSPQSSNLSTDGLDFDLSSLGGSSHSHGGFNFDIRPPSPLSTNYNIMNHGSLSSSDQENHVMYYFENVRKVHFLFGSNTMTNVTYSLIVQEPRGAVTNAVCALANLHFKRMRVAQGFEAPDPNPELSAAKYYYDEAFFQLTNAKQIRGCYNESDVIAALHLVCFSQLSGGATDWQPVLAMALEWIAQIGLPVEEDPKMALRGMNTAAQVAVKCTMWNDIFASLTLMRPPKFFSLYKRLLGRDVWNGTATKPVSETSSLQMDSLTGCPDEAMLAIAEVSALAHWKSAERRKGTLSYRELIRRGDDIEQRLRQHQTDPSMGDQAPLHPNLLQPSISDNTTSFPSDDIRRTLGNVFRETAILYLHTVLNDPNPGVPDINASVENIIRLIRQLPPSDADRAIVFSICIAACMTDDSSRRDFLKGRLQAQDENIGNLMRTRLLMEAVWQKRDVIGGGTVDWRETMRLISALDTKSAETCCERDASNEIISRRALYPIPLNSPSLLRGRTNFYSTFCHSLTLRERQRPGAVKASLFKDIRYTSRASVNATTRSTFAYKNTRGSLLLNPFPRTPGLKSNYTILKISRSVQDERFSCCLLVFDLIRTQATKRRKASPSDDVNEKALSGTLRQ